jgi:tetratricopeptide (TPR) repeat protein
VLLIVVSINAGEDSLLSEAQIHSRNGNYAKAHVLCDSILQINQSHSDALFLKGLMFSWEGKCDSASVMLLKARELAPQYKDIHTALIKLFTWCNKDEALNAAVEFARKQFPDDSSFSLSESGTSNNVSGLQQQTLALVTIESFNKHGPGNAWVSAMVSHRYNVKQLTLHPAVQLSRRWYGSTLLYAFEGNLDASIVFTRPMMLSVSISGSPYMYSDSLFPVLGVSTGLHFIVKKSAEVNFSVRYRNYIKDYSITISSGLGLYVGMTEIQTTLWLAPWNEQLYVSATASLRRYYSNNQRLYLTLKGGVGKSPPENNMRSIEYVFAFGELSTSLPLSKRIDIQPFLELRKAQNGFATPYLHVRSGTGMRYHW